MNLPRRLLRRALGERGPIVEGELRVEGPSAEITIARDDHGIPHLEAAGDEDAAFGLGFVHGQDRAFQLELLLRAVRGTLSELVGREALSIDRLARRVGFRRAAEGQLAACDGGIRSWVGAYARGASAGATVGATRRAHEFVLLRSRPTPWEPADVLGVGMVAAFLLDSNWDAELARLLILTLDGVEALEALDLAPPDRIGGIVDRATPGAEVTARLAEDLRRFAEAVGTGGGSNAWALAASRTSTGRPLLANDPHLAPAVPGPWYLAHVRTPEWEAAGATFVGTPAFAAGHNGHGAWGVTSALVDDSDLFVEELDGARVRTPEGFVPCERRVEAIRVRGGKPVEEVVLVTPNGPVVGPTLHGAPHGLSLRATWLEPRPIVGLLRAHRARSFEEFRGLFDRWPATPFTLVWTDRSGAIGRLVAATAPRRRKGYGMVPGAGWDVAAGWEETHAASEDLPYRADPAEGFVAAANEELTSSDVYLGSDFLEGYRLARIHEALAGREDWDLPALQQLQLDTSSLPWREIRETVLAVDPGGPDAATAQRLLRGWDGRLDPRSPAATVWTLAARELIGRAVRARAPRAATWAVGTGFTVLTRANLFGARWAGRLSSLLTEQPDGWFEGGWPAEISDALAGAVRRLRDRHGEDPQRWAWGRVRPLVLPHALGVRRPLARIFNLGPVPIGGDGNTIAQAAVHPDDPSSPPLGIASLRAVIDVGEWSASRFSLPGGQSGNPCSPHYDDLLPLWRAGAGVPIPWTPEDVRSAARATLRLRPSD